MCVCMACMYNSWWWWFACRPCTCPTPPLPFLPHPSLPFCPYYPPPLPPFPCPSLPPSPTYTYTPSLHFLPAAFPLATYACLVTFPCRATAYLPYHPMPNICVPLPFVHLPACLPFTFLLLLPSPYHPTCHLLPPSHLPPPNPHLPFPSLAFFLYPPFLTFYLYMCIVSSVYAMFMCLLVYSYGSVCSGVCLLSAHTHIPACTFLHTPLLLLFLRFTHTTHHLHYLFVRILTSYTYGSLSAFAFLVYMRFGSFILSCIYFGSALCIA